MEQAPREWRLIEPSETIAQANTPASQAVPAHSPLVLALVVGLLGAAVCAALVLATSAGSARDVAISPAPAATATADATAALVVVDVGGGVRRPGVYRLETGTRVADAIVAAGGFGPTVDAAAVNATLNLAALIEDGEKIAVPERGAGAAEAQSSAASRTTRPGRIDLNTATQAELESLPGIGPVTAQKIIEARREAPFRSLDELTARKVLGASTLEKIRDLVSLGG
jgi:competence protein ComEA